MNGLTLTVQGPPGVEPEQRLVGKIPPGDAGTEATIAAMVALIRESSQGPRVQDLATYLKNVMRRTHLPTALFTWLKGAIKFHSDPKGLEFLRHPERMLQAWEISRRTRNGKRPVGDCDDMADLGASVLLAAGESPVLVVVAPDDGDFKHVYFGIRQGADGYFPLDPQEMDAPGQEVTAGRRRVFDVRG